jgi:hypothetical protein
MTYSGFLASTFESKVMCAVGNDFLIAQNAGSETRVSPRCPILKTKMRLKSNL